MVPYGCDKIVCKFSPVASHWGSFNQVAPRRALHSKRESSYRKYKRLKKGPTLNTKSQQTSW